MPSLLRIKCLVLSSILFKTLILEVSKMIEYLEYIVFVAFFYYRIELNHFHKLRYKVKINMNLSVGSYIS